MRSLRLLLLPFCALALFAVGCSETPTSSTVTLGKTTLAEFMTNAGYMAWYQTGYDVYPFTEDQAAFDAAVATIEANLGEVGADYQMLMVIKPNCGCQHTQREMPRVMKTLDAAGFSQDDIEIWLTDSPLNGIGDIKTAHSIDTAPTFLLLRNGVELGRLEVDEEIPGADVATQLASFFDN